MDCAETRVAFLTGGICLRGKSIPVYNSNPGNPYIEHDDRIRVRITNIPLSADDGQIKHALTLRQCDVKNVFREKLRVDGRLTNCETGDRIAVVRDMKAPLPKVIEIGRYWVVVVHKGPVNGKLNCNKCLQTGHVSKD